jgi:hypothetical protein
MIFQTQAFRDAFNKRMVNYYRDRLGREWMAQSRWSLFRVERSRISKGRYR